MATETDGMADNNPFIAFKQRIRQAALADQERCDLCGEAIGPEHRHLLNLANREVLCACRACSFLLETPASGGRARRLIPTRYLHLTDFRMTDTQWADLQVPVNMAFFCYHTDAQRTLANYPSPMGPTEAMLPPDIWEEMVQSHPILQQMEPDVEALLVRRDRQDEDYFLVPIDACYRLVGLIRLHWRGLSGGSEVRQEIERYFLQLKAQATPTGDGHA